MYRPHVLIALLLVAGAVMLATGCTGDKPEPATGIPGPITTKLVPSTLPVTTASFVPVRTTCPVPDNASFWINVSPIARIERGEILRINGTTNIPAGNHLTVFVYPGSFHPHCRCCYDDQLDADVVVRDEGGCANTFSLWFDSSSFLPEEYVISAADPEDNTQSPTIIVPLVENTTPLSIPAGNPSAPVSGSAVLPVFQPPDVAWGDILTIAGSRNGTLYPVRYAIRDAYADAACQPRCEGAKLQGFVHSGETSDGTDRFAIRFSTEDMSPGRYVADLELICREQDMPVQVWFNVTEPTAGAGP